MDLDARHGVSWRCPARGLVAVPGTAYVVIAACLVVSRSTGRLASAGGNDSAPSRRQAATPVMAVASGAPLAQIVSGRISVSVPAPASGATRRVNTIPVQ